MMKKLLIIFITLFLTGKIIADDGVFYAQGDNLIPLEETNIELQKEILILDRQNGSNPNENRNLNVDVYFEFYNPNSEVEKLVGFVTPPASDLLRERIDIKHPQISNFCVFVNDVLISYKISRIDSSNFQSYFGKSEGQDFIYYFKVRFKKGLNIIKHTYSYTGSYMSGYEMPGPNFDYRLTTGKTWANKKINSFELFINMGENAYFSVPASFKAGEKADWKILGIGKIGNTIDNPSKAIRIKMNSGFLYYKSTDFRPDIDLSVYPINPLLDLKDYVDILYKSKWSNGRNLNELTNSDLRILRNLFYALRGYEFKTKDLFNYYSKFDWYMPDPNIREEQIELNKWDKKLFDEIHEEEMKRQ